MLCMNNDCAGMGTCRLRRMSADIAARAAISWFPSDGKRKIGGPHIDWTQVVKQDITTGFVQILEKYGKSWNLT